MSGALPSERTDRTPIDHRSFPADINRTLEATDTIVIGDSFSDGRLWQGEFERLTSRRTLTYHYDQVGCLNNWLEFLQERKSHQRALVVLEVVEREFVPRLQSLGPCAHSVPRPVPVKESPFDSTPTFDANFNVKTFFNEFLDRSSRAHQSGEAVSMPIAGSGLFSNSRAQRLLYYLGDERKALWSPAQLSGCVANLLAMRDTLALHGFDFIVLLIPDKSTVYREHFLAPRFEPPQLDEALHRTGLSAVRLTPMLRARKSVVTDLYLPNDSHLSDEGYRLVATELAFAVAARQRDQPAGASVAALPSPAPGAARSSAAAASSGEPGARR